MSSRQRFRTTLRQLSSELAAAHEGEVAALQAEVAQLRGVKATANEDCESQQQPRPILRSESNHLAAPEKEETPELNAWNELQGPSGHVSYPLTQHASTFDPDAWQLPVSPAPADHKTHANGDRNLHSALSIIAALHPVYPHKASGNHTHADAQPGEQAYNGQYSHQNGVSSKLAEDEDKEPQKVASRYTFSSNHEDLMAKAICQHYQLDGSIEDFKEGMLQRGRSHLTEELPKIKHDTSFSSVFASDTDLDRPIYDVEDHYKNEGCGQAFARSNKFAALSQAVICVNAVYLGIDSDYNEASNIYEADFVFRVFENVFCAFFTFEWIVRLLAFKSLRACFHDGWMRFDSLLVVTMVFEAWVLLPLLFFQGGDAVSLPLGPLRLLRLLKITRMARLMRAFPELVILVKGIFRSLRAISGSLILVVIILYTFSIFLHMLLKGEERLNAALAKDVATDFTTMPRCMWTLFACAVFMDGFADVATRLMYSGTGNGMFAAWTFLVFAVLTALTVFNMLIGVLCEVVSETTKEHAAAKDIAVMKSQIHERLRKFDDGDGLITQTELANILKDPHSKAVLRSLNINELFLLQMLKLMYPKPDSVVTFKPLTEIMLMCRGDNQATVETMASGFAFLVNEVRDIQHALEDITRTFNVKRTLKTGAAAAADTSEVELAAV